jgi:RHS repeat-associated protein
MRPKPLVRVRPHPSVAATFAFAVGFLAYLAPAHAQFECELRSNCPAEQASCWTCTSPTSNITQSDSGDGFQAQTGRSRGADIGAVQIGREFPNLSLAPRPTGPQRISRQGETAAESARNWYDTQVFEEEARSGRTDIDRVFDAVRGRGDGAGVRVPVAQGVDRATSPSGVPTAPHAGGQHDDPIDPVTGELVVEHDDLSFPSFGVPFSHRRVYRSRTEYDGPLGYGWDFSYNQRLVAAPVVDDPEVPPQLDPMTGLPLADAGSEMMSIDGGRHCGPVLLLTTGSASTLRFRERGRAAETITYESDASDVELVGTIDGDDTTWVLTSKAGDHRTFDSTGLLASWVDSNGIGLSFTWELDGRGDRRLALVQDSVGRIIEFKYGDNGLKEVVEPKSGLRATYEYDENGGLRRAVRGDGRSETYEYDFSKAGRSTGDWIPEGQAKGACSNACAMSTRSCDAGGACDTPVAAATSACLASCPACAEQCNEDCGFACQSSCGSGCSGECGSWCDAPAQYDPIRTGCESLFDSSGSDDACDACVDSCRGSTEETCDFVVTCLLATTESDPGPGNNEELAEGCIRWTGTSDFGEDLLRGVQLVATALFETLECAFSWLPGVECSYNSTEDVIDHICVNDAGDCCAYGNNCADNSCTENVDCRDACRDTFLGYAVGGDCPAPATPSVGIGHIEYETCRRLAQATPVPGTELYDLLIECAGTASDWSQANGCVPRGVADCNDECRGECMQPCMGDCRADCGTVCADKCRVNDCATYCIGLDLPGQCEDSCTDACVDENHRRGSFDGPKYGYTADLQFNLIRVYDGNGNLYLENTYGQDIASPDFDTVVAQRFGEHDVQMTHVNYAATAEPSVSWADDMVDSLADYDAPAICHYGCEASPPRRNDLAVPYNDVILVFSGELGDIPSGGWSVSGSSKTLFSLPPSFINMTSDGAGTVSARSAKTASLFGAAFYLELKSGGVNVKVDEKGLVSLMSKNDAALAELALAGGVTLFGDGASLRAYPGAPYTAVTSAKGSCKKPFQVTRTGAEEITITPADACAQELWLVPVATRAQIDALEFMAKGQAAITTSHFRPSPLSPVRMPTVLFMADTKTGVMTRRRAPSGPATEKAAKQAQSLYKGAPLFSAPIVSNLNEPPPDEPIFVFHHGKAGGLGTYPPSAPPSDAAWTDQDLLEEMYNPPCDPAVPGNVVWGTGESGDGVKPASATATIDMHDARWTFYADASGRVIREVNHENGASRWMEYDPDGRITGVLEPDGARQCLKYDDNGSVIEILSLASFNIDLVTPVPVRQRLAWTASPARLAVVMDPRNPTRELRRMQYDTAGNLVSITEIDGTRTTIVPVGGTSPSRAMPERITAPDGTVTKFKYDSSNGTVLVATVDATGPSPVVTETVSDFAGRPETVVSPLGLLEHYEWDGPLLVAHGIDADGHQRLESFEYDDDAQLTKINGPRAATSLTYTAIGGLATVSKSALDGSVATAMRCQQTGPNGRVYEEVSAEGVRTRYTRDAEGRVTSVVAGDLGPSPLEWDDACPPRASGESVVGTVATYEYDIGGRLKAMVDGRGLRTAWTYDGFGRAIIEKRPDGSEVRTGYDAIGNVAWQAVYVATPNGQYRAPGWGDAGLLAAVELRYDIKNRVSEEMRWHFEPGGPVGDGYARTAYAYDDIARTVTVTDDVGRSTRVRTDGVGRTVEVRLPDGSVVVTAFQDGGRTVRTTRTAVGGAVVDTVSLAATGAAAETAIEVGGVRRVTSSTSWTDPYLPDAMRSMTGVVTTPQYDALDRVVGSSVARPDGVGERVEVVLDRDGRVTARRSFASSDAPASTWDFGYDALGRVVAETDPADAVTTTSYVGTTGLAWTTVDPRLVRTTNTWATGGWLAQSVVDAPTGEDVTLAYSHDALGQMITASRRDGATTALTNGFSYDSLGNLLASTDSTLGTTTATHRSNGVGQRTSSTYGTHSVSRLFDPLGRLTSLRVGADSPATATWTYSGHGGPTGRQLRNGVNTSYSYDALSRLTGVTDWRGATRIANHEWELPLDGVPRRYGSQQNNLTAQNRLYAIDSAGRLGAEQAAATASFQLSALDDSAQATMTAIGSMSFSAANFYTLDGRNNWVSRWNGSTNIAYGRDARDALTSVGSQAVTSDATGAVTGDGATTYRYDALGLVSEVRPVSGGGRIYKRDGLGRIVMETDIASGASTRFGWDGAQRVLVKRPDGSLETTIPSGLDQPVVTLFPNGTRRYFHQDRQGSVYAQTDEAGVGQLWISYNAYGEPTLRDGSGTVLLASSVRPNFGYHGLPHDWGLGLVDMRARAYRPTLGRFLSPDPIKLAGGANLFAFVDSGPLTWRDPFGLAKNGAWPQFQEPGLVDDVSYVGGEILAGATDFADTLRLHAECNIKYSIAGCALKEARDRAYQTKDFASAAYNNPEAVALSFISVRAATYAAIDWIVERRMSLPGGGRGFHPQANSSGGHGTGGGGTGGAGHGHAGPAWGVDDFISFFHGTSRQGEASLRSTGIDLAYSGPQNDFGRGFYLSENRAMAQLRAEQMFEGDAVVLEYRVPRSEYAKLDRLHFDGPTQAWSDFVRFHRQYEPGSLMHGGQKYDVVSGPMWRDLPPTRFGADGRTVGHWPWPSDSQISIHTQWAIGLFNGGLQ